MKSLLLWLWVGFAWASSGVTIEAWISNQPKSGVGTLVVQMEIPEGLEIQWPEPEVEGLRFTETDTPQTEQFGGTSVVRRSFRFSGKPGHYEIPPFSVEWKTGDVVETASTQSIFVDLEKDPIRTEPLSDIVEPSQIWTVPEWVKWTIAVLLLALSALVAASVFLKRMVSAPTSTVEEPPDVVAIRAWEAIRADTLLDDFQKSVEISRIFRAYTESALGFAATAWTTLEIVNYLDSMPHLKSGNVPRAKRLLRATDRIKFADAAAAAELFENLDSDLRGFIGSTRPTTWGENA